MKTYIYKITNKINQKLYVGKTSLEDPYRRWNQHLQIAKNKDANLKNHTFQLIHKAIVKYSKKNFIFEIVEECMTWELGIEREMFWIKYYGSFGKLGYNQTAGGEGSIGFRHSEATKKKMSEQRRGKRKGSENSFFGKHHSDEVKALLREKGKSREVVPFKGRHHTEKTKKILSDQKKGKKQTLSRIEKSSKLSSKEVIEIRDFYDRKQYTVMELSVKYGVHLSNIYYIVKRQTWKNI